MEIQKAIIFDAGTLISFSMNGLLNQIENLKSLFKGKFLITNEVKKEIIDKPITIKRFELEAIMIQSLIEKGIIEPSSSIGIDDSEIQRKVEELQKQVNSIFMGKNNKPISIIHSGETSCLALSSLLTEKGIQNVIAMDERTTRMLVENPQDLQNYLERKLHTKISGNAKNLKFDKQFKIIRSTELIYVAYKKGLINIKGPKVLDALLYAMKFKGTSITNDEIEEIKKLG